MGCTFSTKKPSSSTSSSKSPKTKNKPIRIIHFSGSIQEFDKPVTVAEVTSHYPTKHLLFTHSQLLASCSTPLKRGMVLEPGRVYFSLPGTLFGPNVSPVDLAPIARKLMSKAQSSSSKRRHSKHKSRKKRSVSISSSSSAASSSVSSPTSSVGGRVDNPIRSAPDIYMSSSYRDHNIRSGNLAVRMDNCQVLYEMNSCKPRSWKPILDTIREISLNK